MSAALSALNHPEFLVETEWLAARLGEPNLRVIDCTVHIRFDPALVGPTRSRAVRISSRATYPTRSLSMS